MKKQEKEILKEKLYLTILPVMESLLVFITEMILMKKIITVVVSVIRN